MMPYQRNWLLLRGLTRESGHWGAFLPALRAALPSARVDTLDLPGTGRFHRQASPTSIADIVGTARRQALQDGLLDTPIVIIAISLGGMVAWQWLHQYPQDIARCVLINSSFAGISPFYRRLQPQQYATLLQIAAAKSDFDKELAIARMVSNLDDAQRRLVASQWAEIRNRRPINAANSLRQLLAAARFRPQRQAPAQPVLLLSSLGDRMVAPTCSQTIAQNWHLPLRCHPTAGHDLPLDAGDWVIAQLLEWVSV